VQRFAGSAAGSSYTAGTESTFTLKALLDALVAWVVANDQVLFCQGLDVARHC
jgi:hypothetical protein